MNTTWNTAWGAPPPPPPTTASGFPDVAAMREQVRHLKSRRQRPAPAQTDCIPHGPWFIYLQQRARGAVAVIRSSRQITKATICHTTTAHTAAAALAKAMAWCTEQTIATGGHPGDHEGWAPPPPPPGSGGPGPWEDWDPFSGEAGWRPRGRKAPAMPLSVALELLGLPVAEPLTLEAVGTAFRERARLAHPDAGGTAERFHQLIAARDCARRHLRPRLPQ
jgi:hypothetical protein